MKNVIAVASFVCAVLFAGAAMIIPPQGVIDASVLVLIAQLLVLCATFFGVESYVNIIMARGKRLKAKG